MPARNNWLKILISTSKDAGLSFPAFSSARWVQNVLGQHLTSPLHFVYTWRLAMQFKFMTKLLNLRTTTGVISSFKQNTLNKEGKKKLKKREKNEKMCIHNVPTHLQREGWVFLRMRWWDEWSQLTWWRWSNEAWWDLVRRADTTTEWLESRMHNRRRCPRWMDLAGPRRW